MVGFPNFEIHAAKLEYSIEYGLLSAVTLVIVCLWAKAFQKCAFIPDRAIECTLHKMVVIYVLLCGGTKRSQRRDIVRAKELARILKGK